MAIRAGKKKIFFECVFYYNQWLAFMILGGIQESNLSNQLDGTTDSLDLLLGSAGDVAGLDDDGLGGETTLGEDLAVTGTESVDDGDDLGLLGSVLAGLLGNEGPEGVQVDDGAVLAVAGQVEATHTDLTEVTGMVLVHVDTVVVLTTSKTTSSGMLAVLTWKVEDNEKMVNCLF
jgi:hypothetical protein